jgi:hypothetical protein
MRPIDALSFTDGRFSTSADYDGKTITLHLVGDGNMSAIAPLEDTLIALHAEALRLRASIVALDLVRLEFMNSACFKKVLTWVGRVQGMDAQTQYRIRLISNPKTLWQRRSLHALRCFAVDLISIDA